MTESKRDSDGGINRIRLEFKEKQKDWIRELNKVLIESDWNLKLIN